MRELETLFDFQLEKRRRDLEGSAMICAAIANWAGKTLQKGKTVQPSDFLRPTEYVEEGAEDGAPASDEALLMKSMAIFGAMGGGEDKPAGYENVDEDGEVWFHKGA